MMDRSLRLRNTGFLAFFFSGICAISSGIIVSILQETYGFSYGTTGLLLSCMNVGNITASFASGILPAKIGAKNTVFIFCSGYFLGYLAMTLTGLVPLLIIAFVIVGIAKGCTINNCTVLVGNNSKDRTKGMSIMHACYACGALLCPFLIAALVTRSSRLPMIGVAVVGFFLWLAFVTAGLPGKIASKGEKARTDFSFMRSSRFWLLTALIFCQNAAETSVTGWMVTYYKNQGILSGTLSTYTVTIMWSATLLIRLLIAFVFPMKNTFKSLTIMGLGCTIFYGLMIAVDAPIGAILLLSAFSFAMGGVNPVAVAGIGKEMSSASIGVMLPVAAIGTVIMPAVIGKVADLVSLRAGMFVNLLPCLGIMIFSIVLQKMKK